MEKHKSTSVADVVVTYGVAVVSIIVACVFGAYSLAGAIATFADTTASMPSIFGILGGGGTTSLIVTAALAVFGGVIGQMAMKKITASKNANELVASSSYQMINHNHPHSGWFALRLKASLTSMRLKALCLSLRSSHYAFGTTPTP